MCKTEKNKEWNILKEMRNLYIQGAVLEKGQMENHLEKIASDHILKSHSDKDTYPIPRLRDNFVAITEVYNLLNDQMKRKIPIHPAGEWILDNYYVIEKTVKTIAKDLSPQKYVKFNGLASGPYMGFARIYVLACEIVGCTDASINRVNLYQLLEAYQRKKDLSMEEIWSISLFLNIALIENIRRIAEKIYNAQVQKIRVEEILEKTIEQKEENTVRLNHRREYQKRLTKEDELKYSFIEYLSYRLRKYGKKAYPYLNILEEITNKLGTDVSSVIKKEHFEVAINKVSMGNSITSIKTIQRVNFLEIFEKLNSVEEVLKQDPTGVYEKMDFPTKEWYRNVIKKMAKKNHISEIYLAKKALELAQRKDLPLPEQHIGYYLIDDGIAELLTKIRGQKVYLFSKEKKVQIFLFLLFGISIVFSLLLIWYWKKQTGSLWQSIVFGCMSLPLLLQGTKLTGQYLLSKVVKPRRIPKLDMQNGVPEEYATFIVIPTILENAEKAESFLKKLEVFYLANKSDHLYFALLGDCTASSKQEEPEDDAIIQAGRKMAEALNQKYATKESPKFYFFYRSRIWCEGEECFLGWERKRGLLTQFNEFLLTGKREGFAYGDSGKIPKVRYVITLDADTDLVLGTGLELIGAMAHILNNPQCNVENTKVVKGHAMIQPRIGIDLEASLHTGFTKIFAGSGGVDSYTNAISDVYQDNFEEGIYTGKGIYDVGVFQKVLQGKIPENVVLSHDLLEGSYLRCGLASDILLMDGYPKNYLSYQKRALRWLRGDFQISRWLRFQIKDEQGEEIPNPLNLLSKYKIFDNLLRGILPIVFAGTIIWLSVFSIVLQKHFFGLWLLIGLLFALPSVFDLIDFCVYQKDGQKNRKKFTKTYGVVSASIYRALLELVALPDRAWNHLKAISKTIYRMTKQKKHLLEWTTAEEAEKGCKTTLGSYYQAMRANFVASLLCIWFGTIYLSFWLLGLGMFWFLSPYIFYQIGKPQKEKNPLEELTADEKEHLLEVGKRTWQFFKDHLKEKGNYLPPDNYQEDRKEKIAYRTSPTNIGLALLAVASSYDLKWESAEFVLDLYEKMFSSIEKLPKWNGHLYNWYNIETLDPLSPKYISSVDSGNFVGYAYVVKAFLGELQQALPQEKERITFLQEQVTKWIEQTDFSALYSKENRLLSIGYDIEENRLTDSYYDLLASEARQASLIAIAKKDIPQKHWQNLSKTLTVLEGYKGLISWSGTSFEYWMPNVNIPKYPLSLLDESCKFIVMSQERYTKKLGIPWGISEAAFHLKDLYNNYQYKAFGIPWLGLKRGLADEMVVSSYGSILTISDYPKEVVENLKRMQEYGMFQKYGYYESIDFTPTRLRKNKTFELVKTYMAHHQGLILLSINNLFSNQILQKRMMENPEMQSVKILLQERMPEEVVITKEEKEKVEKMKPVDYDAYSQREYLTYNPNRNLSNAISSHHYTVVVNQDGTGYSKYQNRWIYRYKETDEENQGVFFYLKSEKQKKIWSSALLPQESSYDKVKITFYPDGDKWVQTNGNMETTLRIGIDPSEPIEIRRLEVTNHGNQPDNLEITSFLEPMLSTQEQDNAHKAFNNLFLRYSYVEEFEAIVVERKARQENETGMKLAAMLFTEDECIGQMEFEIDKEKFCGRGNLGIPKAVKESKALESKIGYTIDPILAMKKIVKIAPGETVCFDFILYTENSEEFCIEKLAPYRNRDYVQKQFELSRAKTEAENLYLGIKARDLNLYQRILSHLQNPIQLKKMQNKEKPEKADNSILWKYGISGDSPILLAKISQVADSEVLEDLLKAYEYYRLKNIAIELVILNEEKETYEAYVKEMILNAISNRNLLYLQNQKNGIFVLNGVQEKEDKKVLEFRASFIVDCHAGDLEEQFNEMEEEENGRRSIGRKETYEKRELLPEDTTQDRIFEEGEYSNGYGRFVENGKEYQICVSKQERTPAVWSHILANEKFGTILTESLGGYTYYKNARLNRLTAWNNNSVTDVPSEVIYFYEEETKQKWSLGLNPMPDEKKYWVTYGFGYAKFSHRCQGLEQEMLVFVPQKDSVKVQILTLKNLEPKRRKLKIYYYVKPVLDEDEKKSHHFLNLDCQEENNAILFENTIQMETKQTGYIASSEKIHSYTGDKFGFLGKGNLENPEGVSSGVLDGHNALFSEGRVVMELSIIIEAFEEKKVVLLLGCEEEKEAIPKQIEKYTEGENCLEEFRKVKQYWEELLGRVQVKTESASTNILLNGWCIYQTICSRILARSGYYQSGGAFGFRDQLQDSLSLLYFAPEKTKEQILKHASHQFIEGDVEHWWHEETQRGIRTRFSDDLLWLPYVVGKYIAYTGDSQILEEKVPYLSGEVLPEGVDEKYDVHKPSQEVGTIYEHCIKAIEKADTKGENGLPQIGSGDWNDGFNTVGNKGKGESVWLGFFLFAVLDQMQTICQERNDKQRAERYQKRKEELKKSLNQKGWDGSWYKRAFTDEGKELGSRQNAECRIDSISQTWSVISRAGDNDKQYIAMESLERYLVKEDLGMIQLLDPPFDTGELKPGYIQSYLPGTRENGGQYTHAAMWCVIAECLLGFSEKAFSYFQMLNPIEHSKTKEEAKRYKVEPYVIPADIYGSANLAGRGGWTWYTGSSSWAFLAGVEYLLGLHIEKGVLTIRPCVPKEWKEYEIHFHYGESLYHIKVQNPEQKQTEEQIWMCNGKEVPEKEIRLEKEGGIYKIEITLA